MTESIVPVTGSVISDPDAQVAIWFLGALSQVRVSGAQTGGAFALADHLAQRGNASPVHVHDRDDETFFVSSTAVNPTLTIIANALRVADHIAGRLGAAGLARGAAGTGDRSCLTYRSPTCSWSRRSDSASPRPRRSQPAETSRDTTNLFSTMRTNSADRGGD